MSRLHLDLEVLRSFVTGVELGSFALAAQQLHLSTSAISAQLKRLQAQIGTPLLEKTGRGLTPTAHGEALLSYARRLLELNDEAIQAVRGAPLQGAIRVGLAEDFGASLLPGILSRFAQAHPQLRIDARVCRTATLMEALARDTLDLALVWGDDHDWPYSQHLCRLPLHWIGSADPAPAGGPVCLATLEAPCLMRQRACDALDHAGLEWRESFSSSSLAAIWAAVAAGLGVTVRTAAGMPDHLRIRHDLPTLPAINLLLCWNQARPGTAVQQLAAIIENAVHTSVPGMARSA
ncbi:LysR family transcriptional regulator [Stenotrophomonas maltophilia]|nr:LysR family transcriptional regulator [Stenotrophomonas maltophilia]MBN4962274.1 LysR family transcriptional regulator [Stenotrophomonas maltophilia]